MVEFTSNNACALEGPRNAWTAAATSVLTGRTAAGGVERGDADGRVAQVEQRWRDLLAYRRLSPEELKCKNAVVYGMLSFDAGGQAVSNGNNIGVSAKLEKTGGISAATAAYFTPGLAIRERHKSIQQGEQGAASIFVGMVLEVCKEEPMRPFFAPLSVFLRSIVLERPEALFTAIFLALDPLKVNTRMLFSVLASQGYGYHHYAGGTVAVVVFTIDIYSFE